MELKGTVVVVTGAARGLGRAIAEGFVGKGSRVALVDMLKDELLRTADEMTATGARVLPVTTDTTVPSEVDAMAARVREELGPVDVLVNCAGSLSAIGPVWEVDRARWLRDVTVNLCGTFLVCKAFVGEMVERKRGYILNMLGGGVNDAHVYTTGYASSKTGLLRFTEGLAREAEPHGVKVFAMQPGAVLTAMTRFIMDSPEGKKWRPGFKKIFETGRDYPPESIAKLALRLVSGDADRLTGRYFDVQKDYEGAIRNADQILEQDLLTLRLRLMAP